MPEEEVAVIESHAVPLFKIHLDLDLVTADLLQGDQRRVHGGS